MSAHSVSIFDHVTQLQLPVPAGTGINSGCGLANRAWVACGIGYDCQPRRSIVDTDGVERKSAPRGQAILGPDDGYVFLEPTLEDCHTIEPTHAYLYVHGVERLAPDGWRDFRWLDGDRLLYEDANGDTYVLDSATPPWRSTYLAPHVGSHVYDAVHHLLFYTVNAGGPGDGLYLRDL